MWIGKLFVLGILGAASVNAQLTNSTLLGILNTTQLAPSGKFMELLKSDDSFKPIIQLLSNPGNRTLFIPTDQAIQDLMDQSESNGDFSDNVHGTNSSGKAPEVGGSGSEPPPPDAEQGGEQQQVQQHNAAIRAIHAMIPRDLKDLQSNSTNSTNSTSGGGGGNSTQQHNLTASTVPFKQGPYANLTFLNLIQYHIIKGEYLLKDLNNTNVFHSTLTNKTIDKNGNGLAVVVNQLNETGSSDQNSTDQNSQNSTDQSSQDNGEQQQQIQVDQQQNGTNSTSGGNNNQTTPPVPKKYVVGNGVDFANVTIKNIAASNGILNFIDKVLIPPGAPTSVIQNVSDTQTLAQLVQQHNDSAGQINNAHNITIFVPSDQALADANVGSSSVQILEALQNLQAQPNNIQQLIKDHIVQGVYYAENLTEIANQTSGNHSIKNLNNESLPLTYVNATSVKVNNTATVIKPNVLTNNGVMHVIDHLLGEQGGQQQGGQQQGGQQQGGQQQEGSGSQEPDQQQGGQDQGQDQGQQQEGSGSQEPDQQQGGQDQGQDQGQQQEGSGSQEPDQQQGGQDQGQQGGDQGQQ